MLSNWSESVKAWLVRECRQAIRFSWRRPFNNVYALGLALTWCAIGIMPTATILGAPDGDADHPAAIRLAKVGECAAAHYGMTPPKVSVFTEPALVGRQDVLGRWLDDTIHVRADKVDKLWVFRHEFAHAYRDHQHPGLYMNAYVALREGGIHTPEFYAAESKVARVVNECWFALREPEGR